MKSAQTVLLSASLLKHLSAKRPKTRDIRAATVQRLKTGKCVAGKAGLEPATYGTKNRCSTN